jgi:hypothetical protein
MTKEEFIANYLDKSKRLKNHNLPYGLQYLILVAQVEEDAEKKYKSYLKKQQNNETNNR